MPPSENKKIEFGDFQTPLQLASECVLKISDRISGAKTLVEPTCGKGNFIRASLPLNFARYIGWEINDAYVKEARNNLPEKVLVEKRDFFSINWESETEFEYPVVFIGNPPWVTSSVLGQIEGRNLPTKSNFQKHSGFDAITGKSNFDISEWIIIKILQMISRRKASLAFLIKTSVARKLFVYAEKNNLFVNQFTIYGIDAKENFGVSVDACLFFASGVEERPERYICDVYESLNEAEPRSRMGFSKGKLVADIENYTSLSAVDSKSEIRWRSGVKHDRSKVMELKRGNGNFVNGFGEICDIPMDYVYPMYKSSGIAKSPLPPPEYFMIVTQKKIGEDTTAIKKSSEKTWAYLKKYEKYFASRRSSIYKNAPDFAMFGVGEYTFKPWKVAISGLYKSMNFQLVAPYEGKPVVLDDTCYSLGFDTEEEAIFVFELLTSENARKFLESITFSDSKRPITAALLNRISILHLSVIENREDQFHALFGKFLESGNKQREILAV